MVKPLEGLHENILCVSLVQSVLNFNQSLFIFQTPACFYHLQFRNCYNDVFRSKRSESILASRYFRQLVHQIFLYGCHPQLVEFEILYKLLYVVQFAFDLPHMSHLDSKCSMTFLYVISSYCIAQSIIRIN